MLLPFPQAMALLRNWHEDRSWVYVQASLDSSQEEYVFWAQLLRVSDSEVCFAGDGVVLPILLTNCVFDHVSANHIPNIIRQRFKETDCCIFMRCKNGSALLYGRETRVGFVNTFRPGSECRV